MREPDLLCPREIADRLGLSVSRTYALLAAGEIPSVRIAGAIKIPRPAWEHWLQELAERAKVGTA